MPEEVLNSELLQLNRLEWELFSPSLPVNHYRISESRIKPYFEELLDEIMRRHYLPIEHLRAWATLNDVKFNDTCVERITNPDGQYKGAGLFAARDFETSLDFETFLLSVPHELVLSVDLVHDHAKSDGHLRDVLEAVGEFGRSTRGALLIFLLLQITHSSPDLRGSNLGVANPFTDYVAFLPEDFSLPTFYSEEERELLQGTSLADAVEQKLRSLENEFDSLRTSTEEIHWCKKDWWDEKTGHLTIDDWKQVDAMFRSRALELPGTGSAMVPCVDMANHASGNKTVAVYDTTEQKQAVLQLRQGKCLKQGEEVTITYGDEKGVSEMIFSYGFIDSGVTNARQLFLDLDIPTDDPLRLAKKAVCKEAPGVRLYTKENGEIGWESKFVWWSCVNEEDGLGFRILQATDGGKELKVLWKQVELETERLEEILASDSMRDIFQLRAVVVLQKRIEQQASELDETDGQFSEGVHLSGVRPTTWETIRKLRALEFEFLADAYQSMQAQITRLANLGTVQEYLGRIGGLT